MIKQRRNTMYSFRNDYSELAHPRILQAMMDTNLEQASGYSTDKHSGHARDLIKKAIGREDVDVHLIPGGTQVNLITIAAFLRPHEAIITPEDGHTFVHEAGAIEATGHKVLAVKTPDGKLTPELVQPVLDFHSDEHMVKPRLIKISNATEVGSVYTKSEIATLSEFCKTNDLLFYCDGARLGSALMSEGCELTLKDMADLTDAFYIGGTKNGALVGEALIISNESLKADFRYIIKQRGAMLAKGKIIGIQFEELFKDNLFFDLAKHANKMASLINDALKDKGYKLLAESTSNQLFPILSGEKITQLEKDFEFIVMPYDVGAGNHVIRLVTSWATTVESVEALIEAL